MKSNSQNSPLYYANIKDSQFTLKLIDFQSMIQPPQPEFLPPFIDLFNCIML